MELSRKLNFEDEVAQLLGLVSDDISIPGCSALSLTGNYGLSNSFLQIYGNLYCLWNWEVPRDTVLGQASLQQAGGVGSSFKIRIDFNYNPTPASPHCEAKPSHQGHTGRGQCWIRIEIDHYFKILPHSKILLPI